MPNTKTGGNRWVPDIRPENIDTYQETSGADSAEYKIVDAHPIIGGILNRLAFFRTHAAAVWYNRLAGITVKQKLDELNENAVWKRKALNRVFATVGSAMDVSVPELSGAHDCMVTVGIPTGLYTLRACILPANNISVGFEYYSSPSHSFCGHMRRVNTTIYATIYEINGWDVSDVQLVDLLYR